MERRAKLGRPTLYDWEDLIFQSQNNKVEHEYHNGVDFECEPRSFASLVRRTARVRNIPVEVSVDGDVVYFVFHKPAA